MSFDTVKDRDAWFVIRGFVYQADLTIKQWIQLKPNCILELERGEDIDTITNNVNSEEEIRLLGQVKHRSSSVTLDSTKILNIFLNYFEHKKNNPNKTLLFSYITNAKYSKERPAIFPDGTSGIEAWIELSKGEIDHEDSSFVAIRNHLLKKINSELVEDQTALSPAMVERQSLLASFKITVSDNSKFPEFIKGFEWRLNQGTAGDIDTTIKQQLIDLNYVDDIKQANAVYPRLFLRVFKILSEKGIKRLTPELLDTELALPELDTDENKVLSFIEGVLDSLSKTVSDIDERVKTNTNELAAIKSNPTLTGSSEAVFRHQLLTFSTSRPALIINGSLREEKVQILYDDLRSRNWINFQGINGCGKSQMAGLITDKFPDACWLDLRSFSNESDKCLAMLNAFLAEISSTAINHERRSWIHSVVNSLPTDCLIILNDIPALSENQILFETLVFLSQSLALSGRKLITTSNENISPRIISLLSSDTFLEVDDFLFSLKEINEYLVNNSAPDYVIQNANLIKIASTGNPRLVSATIYHLKSSGWGGNSSENIRTIFDEEITNEILNNEQQSISNLISDDNVKELLYRLSLIHWDFSTEQIQAVSEVDDKIIHPSEKLQSLVNVWIQEIKTKTYQISPLIKNIGIGNLSTKTQNEVYTAVAASLVSKKTLDPLTGSRSINLYLKGGDYDNAGNLLLASYQSIKDKETAIALKKWGFLTYWNNEEIPLVMNPVLRIYIRAEQIRLYELIDEDSSFLISELEKIALDDRVSKSDRVLLKMFLVGNPVASNIGSFWEHVDSIIDKWDELDNSYKEFMDAKFVSSLLWVSLAKIKTIENLDTWLKGVDFVENKTATSFYEKEHSQIGVSLISNQILISGGETHPEDYNWQPIDSALKKLSDYFNARKTERLEAVVIKDRIALEFQGYKNQEKAVVLATESIERFSDPIALYLMYEKIGKLLHEDGQIEASQEWLLKAVEIDADDQLNIIDTLIHAASAISKKRVEFSQELCLRAENIASSREDLKELDIIKVQGELGIAHWLNGNIIKCFEVFEKVVSGLLELKESGYNEYWIRLFMWTGHSLGYIATDVNNKQVPTTTVSGEEYTVPYQGIYFFNTKDLSSVYQDDKNAFLCVHMAMIADAANMLKKTHFWSMKAFDLSRKETNQEAFFMISAVCTPYSVVNFKVNEALESQLLAAAISRYFDGDIEKKEKEYKNLDLDALYSNKPSKLWSDSEDTVVSFAIVPMFIMLMTKSLKLEDDYADAKEGFFNGLKNYLEEASNKEYWNEMILLCERLINKNISTSELVKLADIYGQKEMNNLRTICILGLTFITTPSTTTIENLIHGIPYASNLHTNNRGIIKFAIFPFVKNRCVEAIRSEYIGAAKELEEIIERINSIPLNDQNLLQTVLQISVEITDAEVIPQRQSWLYNFDTKVY